MKTLLLLLSITSFLYAQYDREQCQSLIDQIDEVHTTQMNFEQTITDGSESMKLKVKKLLESRHALHDMWQLYTKEEKPQSKIDEIKSALDLHDKYLRDIMNNEDFQKKSRINKHLASLYVQSCQEHEDLTSQSNNLTYANIECFATGYRLGKFEAVEELAEGVSDVIMHYMAEERRNEEFPLAKVAQDCRDLNQSGVNLEACQSILAQVGQREVVVDVDQKEKEKEKVVVIDQEEKEKVVVIDQEEKEKVVVEPDVVVEDDEDLKADEDLKNNEEVVQIECAQGQEIYNGACRVKCGDLEIRMATDPNRCIADEDAQRKNNLRKVQNRKKWGKVLRTGATVALIGGGVLLAAWGLKAIFSNDNKYNDGYNAGYAAGRGPAGGYYYPSQGGGGVYPYVIPSYSGGGMGYNGMPAWGGFNPYMNYIPPYSAANDFSNFSFSF